MSGGPLHREGHGGARRTGVSSWFARLFKLWKDEHEMLSLQTALLPRLPAPGRSHYASHAHG